MLVLEANSRLIPVLSRGKVYLCVVFQDLLIIAYCVMNHTLKHRRPLKALTNVIKMSASQKAPIGKQLNQKF